ncbi:hypothetical protein BH24ACT3_BH24ACT3_10590 [soil metagenome]
MKHATHITAGHQAHAGVARSASSASWTCPGVGTYGTAGTAAMAKFRIATPVFAVFADTNAPRRPEAPSP